MTRAGNMLVTLSLRRLHQPVVLLPPISADPPDVVDSNLAVCVSHR